MVNKNKQCKNDLTIVNIFNKSLPLLISGTPGLYRLVVLFLFSHFFSDNSSVINSYVFATGICIFSGLGFSVNIVKNISGEKDISIINKKYIENFFGVVLLSTFSMVALLLSGLVDKGQMKDIYFLVVSLGVYQLERSYLLGKNCLFYIFILDLCLLLITVLMILFNMEGILTLSIANLAVVFLSLIMSKRVPVLSFDWRIFGKGITLGYINLVSGGIMYILPQIMSSVVSDNAVTLMSMAVAVSGIAIIFPRALLNANIAQISERIKTDNFTKIEYKVLSKKVKIICFALFPFSLVASLIYILVSGVVLTFEIEQFFIVFCITLVVISSQLSIIDSVILVFSNNEKIALVANTVVFSIILGIHLSIKASIFPLVFYSHYFILLSLFFLYVIRYFIFNRFVIDKLF